MANGRSEIADEEAKTWIKWLAGERVEQCRR